jgi:hypothetical protein
MSPLIALIKSLFPHIPSQQERDTAYLNAAKDIYDVERRMQEIENRPRHPFWPAPAFQLGEK